MSVNQTFPTPVSTTISYPDPITQLFQGNMVAWLAGALVVVVLALVVFMVIVKIKMPQLSWKLFMNNVRGGGPIVGSCYENNQMRFYTPKLFQSGIGFDGEWYVWPKAYAANKEDLSAAELEVLMSACTIVGAPGQFYLNYAIQCQVATPKLLAIMQHEQQIQKLQKGEQVKIPIEFFIDAATSLQKSGEKYVTLSPMTINLPLTVKGLKEVLPKSLRKHDLKALENLVRDWVKGQGNGVNWAMIAAILAGIGIIAVIIMHFVG